MYFVLKQKLNATTFTYNLGNKLNRIKKSFHSKEYYMQK